MKAYVITTGVIFALITLAHIVRLALEGFAPKNTFLPALPPDVRRGSASPDVE